MSPIFRRPRDASQPSATPAINEFWEWWSTARTEVESALAAQQARRDEDAAEPPAAQPLPAELFDEIARRFEAIHPDLLWEIGHGDSGPVLTVTGGGDAALRGLAERWLRAAPAAAKQGGWRYFPARQADPSMLAMSLTVADHEFDLDYVRAGVRADQGRAKIHVSLYHPDFLFVSDEVQSQVAYHVLHWALGEDEVARWIGEVQIATDEPVDALRPAMLAAVVEQIAEPFEDLTWLSGEGRTPRGHPSQLRIRFPLHRQDHPLADLHVEVTVPYAQSNPDRLPVGSSASALRDFEKKLGKFGTDAVLAIRITGDGVRVFHLYVDPDSGVVAQLDQLAAGWSEGRAKVVSEPDPGWQGLQPYQP